MKIRLIILLLLISAILPCSGQGYYKIIGDSISGNDIGGAIRLQNGGYISYGRLYVNSFSTRMTVITKTDETGSLVWQKYLLFGSVLFNTLSAGLELPTGELMFFHNYRSAPLNDAFLVIKTDSAGNLLWSKKYTTNTLNDRSIMDVRMSMDNHILVGATIGSLAALYAEQTIFKLDTAGNILWNKGFRMQNGGDDYLKQIQEGPDNYIYMSGDRTFNVGGTGHPTLSKMDSVGNVIWSKQYSLNSPAPRPVFRDMRVLPSGNILVCGSTHPSGTISPFTFLFEADTSGAVLWQQNFNINSVSLTAFSMTVDSLQRVHLKGLVSFMPNNLFEIVTDSSGTIYSSWRADGDFYPVAQLASVSTHPPGFFAWSVVDGGFTKWALIKVDSLTPLCGMQSLNATLFPQFTFTSSNASLVTNVNNLTMANAVLTQGSISNISDGCLLTGVEEITESNAIAVFPNPAMDLINFDLPEPIHSIMIVDSYGKTVYHNYSFNGKTLSLDCSQWEMGIYFVVLNGENKSFYKSRFIIVR